MRAEVITGRIVAERQRVSKAARQIMATDPLFLDTETTGLDDDSEVCEIAVVTASGRTRFQTLVRPTQPIPAEATAIHGITDEMVANAPTFDRVLPNLMAALRNRVVVIYNAEYDVKLIAQSAWAVDETLVGDWQALEVRNVCAMKLFARFYGEWNEQRQDYRWQKLGMAAQFCGLEIPKDLHRARADAMLTLGVMQYMAAQNLG